jgi:hypothetical protein
MANADETAALRTRILALEEELARRSEEPDDGKRRSENFLDLLKDAAEQAEEEHGKVRRAVLLGAAEYLHRTNSVVADFIEGLDRRVKAADRARKRDSKDHRAATLADSIIAELHVALDASANIPQAVLDRAIDAHREEPPLTSKPRTAKASGG